MLFMSGAAPTAEIAAFVDARPARFVEKPFGQPELVAAEISLICQLADPAGSQEPRLRRQRGRAMTKVTKVFPVFAVRDLDEGLVYYRERLGSQSRGHG
jgi:hypothetical protein